MRRCLCMWILCLVAKTAAAQPETWLEAGAMGGFLMPHHNDMLLLVDGHARGVEAAFHFGTDGSRDWHHAFNFPTWGVSAGWYDLASDLLGQSAHLNLFTDLPLDRGRRYSLMMGIGGGYITRPFDEVSNFQNGAIGSHLNAALEMSAYRRWDLGSRLRLRAGIGIRHFSNGAMRAPNSGINVAVASVRIMHRWPGSSADPSPAALPERKKITLDQKPWTFYTGLSGGLKEVLPIGGPMYGAVNLFASAQKPISAKSSWGFELGLNHNASLRHRTREVGGEPASTENLRAYAAAQYLLHFGVLSLRLQAGSYLFPTFRGDGLIFFRYHLVYEKARWQGFLGLKSHFAKADHPELGIAYRIR